MFKTIRSRKRYLILAFLALSYLLAGAHVFHPVFHAHENSCNELAHEQEISGAQQHHDDLAAAFVDENHSCPVCSFLALCSALEFIAPQFFSPSKTQYSLGVDQIQPLYSLYQKGQYIRGPPNVL